MHKISMKIKNAEGQTRLTDFYDLHRNIIERVIENKEKQRRRYEYINENIINSVQQSLSSTKKKYHKGHRYLFLFKYEGPQPLKNADATARFGRYKTIKQTRYNYNEEKAIVFSLPRTLKIWIKHPLGEKTAKELIEARKTAWRVAKSFSRKHGIILLSEKQAGFSEHTVECKPIDEMLRPVITTEPELSKEKLGLTINQTSHKNKIEWTGKTAKERVMALERLLDTNILEKIDTIEKGVGALAEAQSRILNELERRRKPKVKAEVKLPEPPEPTGGDYL